MNKQINDDAYQFTVQCEINDLKKQSCLKEAAPYTFGNGDKTVFKEHMTFEFMPVAAYLNELGYDVFCLNYRAGKLKLMPKPIEDLAAAIAFIRRHAGEWNIDADSYVCGGFSAGGHLAGMWGTLRFGYEKYQIPAPKAIWLNYPMVSADIAEQAGKISGFIVRKLMFCLFIVIFYFMNFIWKNHIIENSV